MGDTRRTGLRKLLPLLCLSLSLLSASAPLPLSLFFPSSLSLASSSDVSLTAPRHCSRRYNFREYVSNTARRSFSLMYSYMRPQIRLKRRTHKLPPRAPCCPALLRRPLVARSRKMANARGRIYMIYLSERRERLKACGMEQVGKAARKRNWFGERAAVYRAP